MLLNYFRLAVRNLFKYKTFSVINLFGMATSIASCLLITTFVLDEILYDRYHPDSARIFRVYNLRTSGDASSYQAIVPYPFADHMQKDFPEIEHIVRIDGYSYGERVF